MAYAPLPQLTEQLEQALEQGELWSAVAQSAELFSALPEDSPASRLRRNAVRPATAAERPWNDEEQTIPVDATRLSSTWAILGLAQFTLRRLQDSEASLRQALTADPSNPFALATMAILLHERRQDDKAVAVTRLLEGTSGMADLIDEIRQEARQRRVACELVERNAYLEPQRTPGFSNWVWLVIWAIIVGATLLAFQPISVVGAVLCAAAPLGLVLVARRLFS